MPAAPPAAKAPEQKSYQVKSQKAVYATVPAVPLLVAYMSEAERKDFVESMTEVQVKKDSVVMRQGDKGNNFYVVKAGALEVNASGAHVRNLAAGSVCGELSILNSNPRTATITVNSEEATLLMSARKNVVNSGLAERMNKKRSELVPFLSGISLFAENLNDYGRAMIADAAQVVKVPKGKHVTTAGTTSSKMFHIIKAGIIKNETDGVELGVQQFFGQDELVQQLAVDEVSRVAHTDVELLILASNSFFSLVPLNALVSDATSQRTALMTGAKKKERRYGESAEVVQLTDAAKRRSSISAQKQTLVKKVQKSEAAKRRIQAALESDHLRRVFSRLNETQMAMVVDGMEERKFKSGEYVMRQGEKGDHFFIVDSGELEATADNNGVSTHLTNFSAGQSFGELALMYGCPRTASICARQDSVLWALDRASFRMILLEANTKKVQMYEGFLANVQMLEALTKAQRARIIDALEEVSYKPGEPIIKEGEAGAYLYIIVSGEVAVTKQGQQQELARRKKGEYFGEASLIEQKPTIASVTAANACMLVRMDGEAFQRLMGNLKNQLNLRKYTKDGQEKTAGSIQEEDDDEEIPPPQAPLAERLGPITLDEFVATKGTLGQGAFAKVLRVKRQSTGKVYALKVMSKADIVAMGQVIHILQETAILNQIAHPFITNKLGALVTPGCIMLVMEYCPGGDLFDVLHKRKPNAFDLSNAQILSSQILLALEYLHSLTIVHRDLKLENVLLAEDGALKVTDFGFAKRITSRSWTLCGTPEYLAPELILEKGHGKAVDYWAFGVLLFELLVGHSPFEAEDHLATYQKVLDGHISFPKKLPSVAVDVITKLLQKDTTRRYGNLRDGAADIKKHAFYASTAFDWSNALTMRSTARAPEFDPNRYEWAPVKKYLDDKPCSRDDDAMFANFELQS